MKAGCLLSLFCLGLFACSPTENVYNNTDPGWSIIAATREQPSQLSIVHEPDNVIKVSDAYQSANNQSLPASVTRIAQFDTTLFLLMPDVKKIEVVSSTNYTHIATVSTAPHSVRDICFANATTAYTANADSSVSIIDMTVWQLIPSRDISLPAPATAITALGNRLCVICQSNNTAHIIATPTNSIEHSINTAPAPSFVGSDKAHGLFDIVCLGAGKISGSETMSEAHLQCYSISKEYVVIDMTIPHTGLDAANVNPRSLLVDEVGFCYLGLNQEICLIDAANNTILGSIGTGAFSRISSNSRRNEVIFFDVEDPLRSTCLVLDKANLRIKSTTLLPISLNAAITP